MHGRASSWQELTGTPMRRHQHQVAGAAGGKSSQQHGKESSETSLARIWRAIDVYARVDEDLQVKTEAGAFVTLGFWALMAVLVVGEIHAFLKTSPPIERVVVDSTMGHRLRINADVTFHSIPCLDVHVDAMDVAGENQLDIDHDMLKQRIGPDGETIGEPFSEVPGEGEENLEVDEDYCGSCFGAKKGCCNTCKEVTDAYTTMGWALHDIRRKAEQCIRDNHIETPVVEGEGCHLSGFMSVNKVSGNFHVAAGEGVMRDGRHVHLYNFDDAEKFNTSHTIHRLSFGEPYPGMRPNPLDGSSRIIDEDVGTGLFQYFIKLVPTINMVGQQAEAGDGKALASGEAEERTLTSQFSYTYRFRSMKGGTEYHNEHADSVDDVPHHHAAHGEDKEEGSEKKEKPSTLLLPGVFFVYDVSPFMVEVLPAAQTPLSHLLIRLCAVAGGAFAVSGIVDSLVFRVSKRLRRHGLLG